ncbi:hypothetical protein [Vibrio navarrensis]|uniref:hypothetical protein n=1 Tax=Vibrio navarrensis TaxID=29495 RepID=UPI00186A0403|nr:hypothetical protein [Vibrio navarrensis]MBE4599054.1 hypothetical protein [Vibrio navarrensis]
MSFNFKESLAKGQASASLVKKNKRELEVLYDELTKTLSEYLGFEVRLYYSPENKGVDTSNSIAASVALINALATPERLATGYTILLLGAEGTSVDKVTLFKYKESDDVYPVTVLINKDKMLCYSQEEYAAAISKVLENSRLNLELIDFKSKVERALQESSEDSEPA